MLCPIENCFSSIIFGFFFFFFSWKLRFLNTEAIREWNVTKEVCVIHIHLGPIATHYVMKLLAFGGPQLLTFDRHLLVRYILYMALNDKIPTAWNTWNNRDHYATKIVNFIDGMINWPCGGSSPRHWLVCNILLVLYMIKDLMLFWKYF